MNVESRQEKYFLYNSLASLLKAIENERTTVDLRNEASVYGIVEQADAFMNIVMKDCVFTDPRGDKFSYDMFFVQARNVRFVHIPPNIRIIPAIKDQLQRISGPQVNVKSEKRTFKTKRAQERQREGVLAVKQILERRSTAKCGSDGSGSD